MKDTKKRSEWLELLPHRTNHVIGKDTRNSAIEQTRSRVLMTVFLQKANSSWDWRNATLVEPADDVEDFAVTAGVVPIEQKHIRFKRIDIGSDFTKCVARLLPKREQRGLHPVQVFENTDLLFENSRILLPQAAQLLQRQVGGLLIIGGNAHGSSIRWR